MKVLLLGEFSSLHKYLKEGLLQLGGVDVRLVANGDGWKQLQGADEVLFQQGASGIKRFYDYYRILRDAEKYKDYDVVQFIHASLFPTLINKKIIKKIIKNNKCISLVAAGDDYALKQAYIEKKFDYYIFDYDKTSLENTLKGKYLRNSEILLANRANVIIPSLYEYAVGYQGKDNLHSVIPFPINVQSLAYSENRVGNKIVFFHGLNTNREKQKGTPFIREALTRLKETYPNDVEVIINGHMPFDKYIELMKRTNVVVDQCCGYGYGINACLALAQGKVVMSCCRQETLRAFGVDKAPIIHAEPSVEQLYGQMKKIVENKKDIPQIAFEGRQYVENVHDYVKVAQQYLEAWKAAAKERR